MEYLGSLLSDRSVYAAHYTPGFLAEARKEGHSYDGTVFFCGSSLPADGLKTLARELVFGRVRRLSAFGPRNVQDLLAFLIDLMSHFGVCWGEIPQAPRDLARFAARYSSGESGRSLIIVVGPKHEYLALTEGVRAELHGMIGTR